MACGTQPRNPERQAPQASFEIPTRHCVSSDYDGPNPGPPLGGLVPTQLFRALRDSQPRATRCLVACVASHVAARFRSPQTSQREEADWAGALCLRLVDALAEAQKCGPGLAPVPRATALAYHAMLQAAESCAKPEVTGHSAGVDALLRDWPSALRRATAEGRPRAVACALLAQAARLLAALRERVSGAAPAVEKAAAWLSAAGPAYRLSVLHFWVRDRSLAWLRERSAQKDAAAFLVPPREARLYALAMRCVTTAWEVTAEATPEDTQTEWDSLCRELGDSGGLNWAGGRALLDACDVVPCACAAAAAWRARQGAGALWAVRPTETPKGDGCFASQELAFLHPRVGGEGPLLRERPLASRVAPSAAHVACAECLIVSGTMSEVPGDAGHEESRRPPAYHCATLTVVCPHCAVALFCCGPCFRQSRHARLCAPRRCAPPCWDPLDNGLRPLCRDILLLRSASPETAGATGIDALAGEQSLTHIARELLRAVDFSRVFSDPSDREGRQSLLSVATLIADAVVNLGIIRRMVDLSPPDVSAGAKWEFELLLRIYLRVLTNAFKVTSTVWDDGSPVIGTAVYRNASKLNHSCDPSALASFVGDTIEVRLTRSVWKGEEIHLSYAPILGCQPRSARQRQLFRQFGFLCCCSACSGPEDEHGTQLPSPAVCLWCLDLHPPAKRLEFVGALFQRSWGRSWREETLPAGIECRCLTGRAQNDACTLSALSTAIEDSAHSAHDADLSLGRYFSSIPGLESIESAFLAAWQAERRRPRPRYGYLAALLTDTFERLVRLGVPELRYLIALRACLALKFLALSAPAGLFQYEHQFFLADVLTYLLGSSLLSESGASRVLEQIDEVVSSLVVYNQATLCRDHALNVTARSLLHRLTLQPLERRDGARKRENAPCN